MKQQTIKNRQRGVVIISGATATGKSLLALELAKKISGEIVNADIGSFYTPLTIGTAKPDWMADSKQIVDGKEIEIKHHLFDILDCPDNFTVVQFRQRLKQLFQEIWDRGNTPILVGGSAFYIKSFFYSQCDIPDTGEWTAKLEASTQSTSELWQELHDIDPERAQRILKGDSYRIIRALAIFKATGKKPSLFQQRTEPLAPFYFIVCTRKREELYKKIDDRVLQMLEGGWQEEIEKIRGTEWQDFLMKKKLIGYDDLLGFGNMATPLNNEIVALIQQKTRNYAKRQIIFLNKLEKELKEAIDSGDLVGQVDEICLTLCDVGLYINGLSEQILKRFG
ncbi:MAG: tRNA (adenosine(37)-N6)-dimethylallyltransferase MiaA [Candidatus Dependentiae bacterium]|nr:tRNA (adenosine(37)-N6)-dimethylallyltransferase MiaA [Candidatus Dependentiae bacterium]